jgi:YHS domain-containing protein
VAILGRILRFVLWLLVATWLVRRLFGWLAHNAKGPAAGTAPPESGQSLHRDPVCGTFVAAGISRTLEHAGQVHHFCSAECRARFIAAHRLQLSA